MEKERMNLSSKKNRSYNAEDFIDYIFTDFIEISGDRICGDDLAIKGGLARLDALPVTVVANMRGSDIQQQMIYNFSMSRPEGYRKALRLMKQAEKFHRPIICFVDTIGAYPGKNAEKCGQITAIANILSEMMFIKVPIITVLIGNGCSGGALALSVADKIIALENATFSIISPKACAEIILKDIQQIDKATLLLRMTASDLQNDGIVDSIIKDYANQQCSFCDIAEELKECINSNINKLTKMSSKKLIKKRRNKYKKIKKEQYLQNEE